MPIFEDINSNVSLRKKNHQQISICFVCLRLTRPTPGIKPGSGQKQKKKRGEEKGLQKRGEKGSELLSANSTSNRLIAVREAGPLGPIEGPPETHTNITVIWYHRAV